MFFRKNKTRKIDDFTRHLSEMNFSFSIISDLKQLRDNFSARIKELVTVEKVHILLFNPDTSKYLPVNELLSFSKHPGGLSFSQADKLIFWLSVNKRALIICENPDIMKFLGPREQDILEKNEIEVVYPFVVMNKVRGLLLLGRKKDQKPLHSHEIANLSLILDQAGFAFESAYSYHLQQERARKMFRADRLATLGELAAGAAHEIRNPLTSIRSSIQYLMKKIPDQDDINMAEELIEEVDRINVIIESMLSFARPQEPKKEIFNLRNLITQLLQLTSNISRKKGINITCNFHPEDEEINADSNQIKQALLNIILNAIQAIDDNDGQIIITVELVIDGSHTKVFIIEISDNGNGIPEENMERIFDPFFTTKNEGTGLGLSITYSLINQHGGEIEFSRINPRGTKVKIKLPA
jgi:two-component system, NtrC family, sensor kinase